MAGRSRLRIGLAEPIGSALPSEGPRFHQRPHALFEEEGIALSTFDQQPFEVFEAWPRPEQRCEQLPRARRRERIQPYLLVIGLAAPGVRVLRPVIHEEEQPGRRQALDQEVQPHLRLGIDPVQVLDHEQHGLYLALP